MSRSHHTGGAPTQRMLRVAELIRQALSEVLTRGLVSDPVLETHVISVAGVRMSPDLKLATIFIMPLGGNQPELIVAALEKHRKYLRTEISHRINLKFAPDLRFRSDQSFDVGAGIDALLDSPKVRQDLQKPIDDTEEPARS